MSRFIRDKLEFNGYLHSLRYICDKEGVDSFVIENDCDFNRVQKLYRSSLHNSNYILSVLYSDNFENDLVNLLDKNNSIKDRKIKNEDIRTTLYKKLKKARFDYCGIGTKKVKWMLNYLSESDLDATILRLVLEIEDCSICAKVYNKELSRIKYNDKENLIYELIDICKLNNINYGFKSSDLSSVNCLVFFDLPIGQVSWHTNIDKDSNKEYNFNWDEKECSTLDKIENYIVINYYEELNNYSKGEINYD